MKKLTKPIGALVALTLAIGVGSAVVASAEEQTGTPSLAVHNYSPDKTDFVDYYGGAGNINPEDGDGVTTFAHASFLIPLCGSAIEMDTHYDLLSLQSAENGGDGVDGWVTYSFAATPGVAGNDKSYPYGGSFGVNGYYFHVNNVSSSTVPNCSEWAMFCVNNGDLREVCRGFVDNIIDARFHFSLVEQEDSTYTLRLTALNEAQTLYKEFTGLSLDKSLFVNENGQTFFSTAIYEGPGCDGQHWEHRNVSIYNANVYTYDASDAEITLAETEYTYEEGVAYKPAVTVRVGETVLTENTDYFVEYRNNRQVGEASAYIYFAGDYAGNDDVVENFDIVEPATASEPEESGSEIVDPTASEGQSEAEQTSGKKKSSGCQGSVAASAIFGLFALAGVAVVAKKR